MNWNEPLLYGCGHFGLPTFQFEFVKAAQLDCRLCTLRAHGEFLELNQRFGRLLATSDEVRLWA